MGYVVVVVLVSKYRKIDFYKVIKDGLNLNDPPVHPQGSVGNGKINLNLLGSWRSSRPSPVV